MYFPTIFYAHNRHSQLPQGWEPTDTHGNQQGKEHLHFFHGEWCPPPLVCPRLWVLLQMLLLSLQVLICVPPGLTVQQFQYLLVKKQAEELYRSPVFHLWDHAGRSSEHRRLNNIVYKTILYHFIMNDV